MWSIRTGLWTRAWQLWRYPSWKMTTQFPDGPLICSFVRCVNGWSIRLSVVPFSICLNSQSEVLIWPKWPIRWLCLYALFHICFLVAWEQSSRAQNSPDTRRAASRRSISDPWWTLSLPETNINISFIDLSNGSLKCVDLHKLNFSDTPD